MAYQYAATSAIRGGVKLAGDLAGSGSTGDAPKVLDHDVVASGDKHTEYSKADGTRAFTGVVAGVTPVGTTDLATKGYVDAAAAGIDWKGSVRVATAAALPAYTRSGNVITASANGALAAVDGITLVLNDRLLVKDGAAGSDNGLYFVSTVGTAGTPYVLTRVTDADASDEVTSGIATFVEEGTVNADTGWVLTTNNPITLNTTALTFTQFTSLGQVTAGAGLTKTGSTIDVGAGNGIQVNADSIEALYGAAGAITTVDAGSAQAAGTNNTAARADHEHAVTTGSTAAGSLAAAAAEGTGAPLARADHVHSTDPGADNVALGTSTNGWQAFASSLFLRAPVSLTGASTLGATALVVGGDVTASAFTTTLPATPVAGRFLMLKMRRDSGTFNWTLDAGAGGLIDGAQTKVLTTGGESAILVCTVGGASPIWAVF